MVIIVNKTPPESTDSPDVVDGLHGHLGRLLQGVPLDGPVEHHEPELEDHPYDEGREEAHRDQAQPPLVGDGEGAGEDEDGEAGHDLPNLPARSGADGLRTGGETGAQGSGVVLLQVEPADLLGEHAGEHLPPDPLHQPGPGQGEGEARHGVGDEEAGPEAAEVEGVFLHFLHRLVRVRVVEDSHHVSKQRPEERRESPETH